MRKFHHGEILGFENTKTICVVCNMGPLISSFLLLAYKAAEAYTVVKIQRTLSRRVCTVFASPLPRDRKHPILPRYDLLKIFYIILLIVFAQFSSVNMSRTKIVFGGGELQNFLF